MNLTDRSVYSLHTKFIRGKLKAGKKPHKEIFYKKNLTKKDLPNPEVFSNCQCTQLTIYVSLQVMSDFTDSMQVIASRSRIIPASIQATVIPSLELVEETAIRPSEGHRSGYMNINLCYTI